MRRLTVGAVVLLMAAGAATAGRAATGAGSIRRVSTPVEGSYIVTFAENVQGPPAAIAAGLASAHGATIEHVYSHALRGFAGRMSEQAALALSRNPRVAMVEENGVARALETQTNPTWGLDRIDQRDLPLDSTYTYNTTGAGVTAYVIDTGIRITHTQFGGRASYGTDKIDNDSIASDCNGHGTHVAGTIGGSTYGVAKAVSLIAVRVLDCGGSGSYAQVIAGVDWVTGHHTTGLAVANMSLGGSTSSSLDNAVNNSINDGITYGLAAGNGNFLGQAVDACGTSPARVPAGMTVSATDSTDRRASFANYGTCVDIFAPGVGVISAWNNSDTGTNNISGTSMATPHAVGAAAMYLEKNPGSTPAQVISALTTNATGGKIPNPGTGSPNKLLYNAFITGGPPGNQAPSAAFTSSCTLLACDFDANGSTDADGTIVDYAWSFGDGATGSGATASHSYAASGSYSVTLTVTDDDGATDTEIQTVSVSDGSATIVLTATGVTSGNRQRTDLAWSGSTPGGNVDIFRNGALLVTTADDGAHMDKFSRRTAGTFTYQVCESGTTSCSNEASVTYT